MFFTQCCVSVVFQMHSMDDGYVQVKFNWKSDGFNSYFSRITKFRDQNKFVVIRSPNISLDSLIFWVP